MTPESVQDRELMDDMEKFLLEERLRNQTYMNRLQQNEIFMLKYKPRIDRLLDNPPC